MATLMVIILLWITPLTLAGWVGSQKGRQGLGLTLGVLLGWLGLLIIALIPPTAEGRRAEALRHGFACPFCQEPVRQGATVCPHCQRDLSTPSPEESRAPAQSPEQG